MPLGRRPIPRQRVLPPRHVLGALREAPPWRDAGDAPVERFEARLAARLGVEGAVALDSGRQALAAILRGLGLAQGTPVVVPAYTFFAVPGAVRDLGLRPVFADLDPRTLNVTPEALESALDASPGAGAAIVTHTFGVPARIAELAALCERRGVALIEDCAHAFASEVAGRPLGAFGTASFFSLETSKQLNAMGGGVAATRDPALLRSIRDALGPPRPAAAGPLVRSALKQAAHTAATSRVLFPAVLYPAARLMSALGRDLENRAVDPSRPVLDGPPARLHPFKAALALAALDAVDADNARRSRLAALLDIALPPHIVRQAFETPPPPLLMFTVLPPSRDALAAALLRAGIDTKRDFLADCSRIFGQGGGDGTGAPAAREAAARALQLPFHPTLSDDDVLRIAEATAAAWGRA